MTTQQSQSFGAIHIEGQGNSLVINQLIQISTSEIKLKKFFGSSPYIGLGRFEEVNKDFFFGRDQLVGQLLGMVATRSLVLVAGASGSGKSSVVRAGLLPQLRARLPLGRFRPVVLTPNRDPFDSLCRALRDAGLSEQQARTADCDAASFPSVLKGLQRSGELWLLFIDQFEELFSLCTELSLRKRFLDALVSLANSAQEELRIVLAMRADFFDHLGRHPEFGELCERGLRLVLDMKMSELRAAIEQPAARHGVVFESNPDLVKQIIDDVQGRPGALPLLQYTLDLLWNTDHPQDDRTLNQDTYLGLGGVEGALEKRAEGLFHFSDPSKVRARSTEQQTTLRQIFLRLVDLTKQGADARVVSKRALLHEFTRPAEQALIVELVDEKLLVSSATELRPGAAPSARAATVEIAHEALLSAWSRLKEWIQQGSEVLFLRNRLVADARQWKLHPADSQLAQDELWAGTRLRQAEEMELRGDFVSVLGGLGSDEKDFLAASLKRRQTQDDEATERRLQRRRLVIGGLSGLSALSIAAGVAALLAVSGQRRAREQEELVKRTLSQTDTESTQLARLGRAVRLWPRNSVAADRIFHQLAGYRHLLPEDDGLPIGARITDIRATAARWLAAGVDPQGHGVVFELPRRTPISGALRLGATVATTARLSPSGRHVLLLGKSAEKDSKPQAASSDDWDWISPLGELVAVYDLSTGKQRPTTRKANESIYFATWSADESKLYLTLVGGRVEEISLETGNSVIVDKIKDANSLYLAPSTGSAAFRLARESYENHHSTLIGRADLLGSSTKDAKDQGAPEADCSTDYSTIISNHTSTPDGLTLAAVCTARARSKDETNYIIVNGRPWTNNEKKSILSVHVKNSHELAYGTFDRSIFIIDNRMVISETADKDFKDYTSFSTSSMIQPDCIGLDATSQHLAVASNDGQLSIFTKYLPMIPAREVKSYKSNDEDVNECSGESASESCNSIRANAELTGGSLISFALIEGRARTVLIYNKPNALKFLIEPTKDEQQLDRYFILPHSGGENTISPQEPLTVAKFSPDGKYLVTGTNPDYRVSGGACEIWRVLSGQRVGMCGGETKKIEFDTHSSRIVSEGRGRIFVSDIDTGLEVLRIVNKSAFPHGYAYIGLLEGQNLLRLEADTWVYDIGFGATGPAPEWLAELAEAVAGGPEEAPIPNRGRRLQALRARLARLPGDDGYAQLARWFFARPRTRTVSPFSSLRAQERLEWLLQSISAKGTSERDDNAYFEAAWLAQLDPVWLEKLRSVGYVTPSELPTWK